MRMGVRVHVKELKAALSRGHLGCRPWDCPPPPDLHSLLLLPKVGVKCPDAGPVSPLLCVFVHTVPCAVEAARMRFLADGDTRCVFPSNRWNTPAHTLYRVTEKRSGGIQCPAELKGLQRPRVNKAFYR
jgi:hypothetical protein